MARLGSLEIVSKNPGNCVVKVVNSQVSSLIDVKGVLNIDAELAKLDKEVKKLDGMIEKTEASITKMEASPSTPSAFLEKTREKLLDLKSKREKNLDFAAELRGMKE